MDESRPSRGFASETAANALGTLIAAAIIYLLSVLGGLVEGKVWLVWVAVSVAGIAVVYMATALYISRQVMKYGQWPRRR